MKYKAVYDVLNERRQTTPGFCYHDRSGWRAYPQTYMTMQRPLWIIAEDAATGRRLCPLVKAAPGGCGLYL